MFVNALLWAIVGLHLGTMWIAMTPVLLIGRAFRVINWEEISQFYVWTARLEHLRR